MIQEEEQYLFCGCVFITITDSGNHYYADELEAAKHCCELL